MGVKRRWERTQSSPSWTQLRVSERLQDAMRVHLRATSWQAMQQHWCPSYRVFTLTHGDFHAGNVLWRGDGDGGGGSGGDRDTDGARRRCLWIDWPEVGVFCPYTDLAQFIVSHVTVDLRRKHERSLVRRYHDRVVSLLQEQPGKVAPTWEDAWERYVAGGKERWLRLFVHLAYIHIRNEKALSLEAVQWFHDQVDSFLEDHPGGKYPPVFQTCYALDF